MACYQLGQLFFDGVPAPKSADAKPAVAAAAAAPASVTADSSADVAAEFVSGPWSLPKNYTQSLLWFTNAAFEGHGQLAHGNGWQCDDKCLRYHDHARLIDH